jgi:hypothetical protein
MFLLVSTMIVLFMFSSIAMTNTYFTIFLHTYRESKSGKKT